MISSATITVLEILLAAAGAIGIRGGGAWLAADATRRQARRAVSRFSARNRSYRRLPDASRADAGALLALICDARGTRARAIESMRRQLPPVSGISWSMPEVHRRIEAVRQSFLKTAADVYKFRAKALITGELRRRWDEDHSVLQHAQDQLSRLDQGFIHLLDKAGFLDAGQTLLGTVTDTISAILPHGLGDEISEKFVHMTSGAFHIPGFLPAFGDAASEVMSLLNEDISLEESFEDGILPALGRWSLRFVGHAVDVAALGATCGLGLLIASHIGKVLTHEHHVTKLNEQCDIIDACQARIEARKRAEQTAINAAGLGFMQAFARQVELCPDIGDEPALIDFISRLRAAYEAALRHAASRAMAYARQAARRLPKANWFDRLLGMSREDEVANLYRAASREINSRLIGIVHHFSQAAETHAEHAIAFLLNQLVIEDPVTDIALASLPECLERTAVDYAESLAAWERECERIWQEGLAIFQAVIRRQREMTAAVVSREGKIIERAARRANSLKRRLHVA